MDSDPDLLVIGAGPAGLMAAETASAAGLSVVVADSMPSPGRKFLMAGKSGLNLTKDEPPDAVFSAFTPLPDPLRRAVAAFGPEKVMAWARGLGQEVFTGSTARVFPVAMKASPLLRAWLGRLDAGGVRLLRRWRWTGWDGAGLAFATPEGSQVLTPRATVLALGGASWARLGSDGAWAGLLAGRGVPLAPFQPANMGLTVDWSAHMAPHFGSPVKNVGLQVGQQTLRGEFVISAAGLEGSAIYALSRPLREGAALTLDLLPDLGTPEVSQRLDHRGKASLSQHLRKALRLDPVRRALLQEFARPLPTDPTALAALIKALPVRHGGPRPMDEAISTAGGVAWEGLDDHLMLRALPGVFCAGEMLDWEAPTGGYLITGALATGRHAATGAMTWLGR